MGKIVVGEGSDGMRASAGTSLRWAAKEALKERRRGRRRAPKIGEKGRVIADVGEPRALLLVRLPRLGGANRNALTTRAHTTLTISPFPVRIK